VIRLAALLLLLGLASCDLARPAAEIRSYMPASSAPPARQPLDARAGRFDAASAFAGKPLVWRFSETRYEHDFYNELLAAPRALLMDRTERWFALRNASEQIGLPPPRYVLEGHIDELYGDVRNRPAHAVLLVRFVLSTTGATPQIVLDRRYEERVQMGSPTPESLAAAYGTAMDRALARLQADVAGLK
jgi:hypothetical protein